MQKHIPTPFGVEVTDIPHTTSGHLSKLNKTKKHALIKRLLLGFGVIGSLFLVANAITYGITRGKLPPGAKLYGVPVAMQREAQATDELHTILDQLSITLKTKDEQQSYNFTDLGISINTAQALQDLRGTGVFRFPIINIARLYATAPTTSLHLQINDTQLGDILQPALQKLELEEPVNAKAAAKEDEGVLTFSSTPSHNGETINAQTIRRQLQSTITSLKHYEIPLKAETAEPKVTDTSLQARIGEFTELLGTPFELTTNEGSFVISPKELRFLLSIDNTANAVDKILYLDAVKIRNYLRTEVSPRLNIPAKLVKSGDSSMRHKGAMDVNTIASAESIIKALNNMQHSAPLVFDNVPAAQHVPGDYARTNAGIQQLLDDFANSNAGIYYVAFEQWSKGDLQAYHNAFDVNFPGSVYKLFLAYALMYEIEKGKYTLQTQTRLGTIEHCIYIMLHHSTNECSRELLKFIGGERVDTILANAGMEDTHLDLSKHDYLESSAHDFLRILRGLYEGTLLSEKHTQHLLSILKGQKWRGGIPAGSPGSIVADKVGFWPGYANDGGIVYSSNGDYGLVIMTEGGTGFGAIQSLANKIHNVMHR